MGLDDGEWGNSSDYFNRRDSYYFDEALICENAHVINSAKKQFPDDNKDFCPNCGRKSLDKCLKCGTPFQGQKFIGNGQLAANFRLQSFCYKCGNALPWTEKVVENACFIASEFMDEHEQEELRKSIDEVIRQTPFSEVAARKIKKLVPKIANGAGTTFRNILTTILSETLKKIIWPDKP
jgi:hypothetical protein